MGVAFLELKLFLSVKRVEVPEAELGLAVLDDEGGEPSNSSSGKVVASGPRTCCWYSSGVTSVFLLDRLNYYSSPVSEHLCHAVHDLIGVVAHADHRIRADLTRVLDHYIECLGTSDLAKLSERGDVAADYRMQRSTKCSEDRARTHGYASHDAERPNYAKAIERERRGHHVMREPVPLRYRIGRIRAQALLRLFQFIEFVFHLLFASSVACQDRCVAN